MKRLRRLAQESEESVRAAQEAHLTVLRKAAVVESQARDAVSTHMALVGLHVAELSSIMITVMNFGLH